MQVLYRQGEAGELVYVVGSGEFESSLQVNGKLHAGHARFLPGDAFGELALMYSCARASTVTRRATRTRCSDGQGACRAQRTTTQATAFCAWVRD